MCKIIIIYVQMGLHEYWCNVATSTDYPWSCLRARTFPNAIVVITFTYTMAEPKRQSIRNKNETTTKLSIVAKEREKNNSVSCLHLVRNSRSSNVYPKLIAFSMHAYITYYSGAKKTLHPYICILSS